MAKVLQSPLRELLQRLGFADFLAVYTVFRRERGAGRIVVPCDVANDVQRMIQDNGVACRTAPWEFLKMPSVVRGTDHIARVVAAGSRADAVLHFGIRDQFAEGAELATITRNHRLLGQLFAYPECCVESFQAAGFRGADRTLCAIASVGPFPAEMNPVTQHLFRPLAFLFHFPCSTNCEPSLLLRRQRQSSIEEFFPELAEINALQTGIALYGERLGIGLITSWSLRETQCYRVHRVLSNDPFVEKLFSDPSRALLTLTDAHNFTIGDSVFAGQSDFAALFQ